MAEIRSEAGVPGFSVALFDPNITSDKIYYVNFKRSPKKEGIPNTLSRTRHAFKIKSDLANFSRLPFTNGLFVAQFDATILVDIKHFDQDVITFL